MAYTTSHIRKAFLEYFVSKHNHKLIKSSSVFSSDPTLLFVNAGMNQFKDVFFGNVVAPCQRAVNSQKCIRIGGKHNDLEVVGTDGHHHTFFEMLGNWSFGDYYKKEACQMAWDLLCGPYQLKPENLAVTYFSGNTRMGLHEDKEVKEIWKSIGVPESRLKGLGIEDNFWEMGITGPCGPCTEIHFVNPDGTLTEIWNLVFIQYFRNNDGSIRPLDSHYVDTGMGLERMSTLLQKVPTNYDTDLFQPIIDAIYKSSDKVPEYGGRYDSNAILDTAYRRLADHSRMISVCLADGVSPAANLKLRNIMYSSFRIASNVFHNPYLLITLYDVVMASLGDTYPELVLKQKECKFIIHHELLMYERTMSDLSVKWENLVKRYPEVEAMRDVHALRFPEGYRYFKEKSSKLNTSIVPANLVFDLHYMYGIQEDNIERIATLNKMTVDKGFDVLLKQHISRSKVGLNEKTNNKGHSMIGAVEKLEKKNFKATNDEFKYIYLVNENNIIFEPLKTELIALLDANCESLDFVKTNSSNIYYLVTKDTNFYCEESGQISDSGLIRIEEELTFNVCSAFKVRGFVLHEGTFSETGKCNKIHSGNIVSLEVDRAKRLNVMKNHTGVHLLYAALKKLMPHCVLYQAGCKVTDKCFSLNLTLYGDKLTDEIILKALDMVNESMETNCALKTRIIDNIETAMEESIVTVPGESYTMSGLRVVEVPPPLPSKELCCGTHVPSTRFVGDLVVLKVKGATANSPTIYAVAGDTAQQVRELFRRAQNLYQQIDVLDIERLQSEIREIKQELEVLCDVPATPFVEYAQCLCLLKSMLTEKSKKQMRQRRT